jgi:uncharacterized membrane protein
VPEANSEYRNVDLVRQMRDLARRMWLSGLGVVAVWSAIIVAAPLLTDLGFGTVARPIYSFFSFLCHQMPERSFHIAGHQFAVCSRCFGVYFGLVAGFLVYPLWRRLDNTEPPARFWLFLSLVPIGIDWSLGVFGIWENTHFSRFLTGLLLGVACATFIIPALVEIRQNMAYRKSRSRQTPASGQ